MFRKKEYKQNILENILKHFKNYLIIFKAQIILRVLAVLKLQNGCIFISIPLIPYMILSLIHIPFTLPSPPKIKKKIKI